MKKVGIIVNSIGYGGNERSAVNIAKTLQEEYDVSIIIQEDCGNHYKFDGSIINLNTPCADSTIGKIINTIRRIYRLRKIIKEKHIETCLIILPITNLINYLTIPCKKIVSCRHCGDLISHTTQYVRMTEKSDMIVCNSIQQTEYIVHSALHLKEKAVTIYNILDIKQIQCLCEATLDISIERFMQGHRCIISSGRLVNQKGINNLLKAFYLLANEDDETRLVIIGEGNLRNSIEKLIENLGLREKVLLTGFQDNPFRYIARADVFALTSFYEGFPNTLVEAMACGTPVVACDCPSGPSEILQSSFSDHMVVGQGGILTGGFDEETSNWDPLDIREEHKKYAEALRAVLTDIELQKQLANAAIERVKDFSPERIRNDWKKIL